MCERKDKKNKNKKSRNIQLYHKLYVANELGQSGYKLGQIWSTRILPPKKNLKKN